jgi:glycosyltransferase involved in cell wall biosynthesis
MKILFVHQNFPGQYKHLAPALAREGHEVAALSMRKHPPTMWQGVRVLTYQAQRGSSRTVHPWVADFETKVIRGEACLHAAEQLKRDGFAPDVIVVHPGWGEGLFLRDVWPHARIGLYCEFFYRTEGQDVGFDPEFARQDAHAASRIRIKNAANLLQFEEAAGGLAPTQWQASTFPEPFRSRIRIAHDGIDTQLVAPRADATVTLRNAAGEVRLARGDEVITFVNRNLEPYRGYHVFMRALPQLLALRPNARVVIVGADDVSYGARPPQGRTWKQVFVDEVRPRIPDADWQRVLFVGTLEYPQFVTMLQLSTVHVYLTYPFVLSWSLLEAMSAGCAIVASDTAPVREAIRHDETGKLVDFFAVDALAQQVASLAADADQRQVLGANARAHAVANYDLATVCLPAQVEWVKSLAG